uniref:Acetyl-CoA C-acyltransferase n=1 Tax=Plectus sambesii TaxID=2011161 RepID=A0A914X0Q8_9BILA
MNIDSVFAQDVVVVSAVRTPIAAFRSSFADVSLKQLGTTVVSEAIKRAGIRPEDVEEVIAGCVLPAGHGQNIARQVSIAAGIPVSAPAMTINKVCSSGLKAIMLAAESLTVSDHRVIVAAGMESMSQAPFFLDRGDTPYGGLKLIDSILKDGLTDAMRDEPMGLCAEKTAEDYNLSRADQDAFAIESYRRVANAWQSGVFADEIVPVTVKPKRGAEYVVKEDEEYKKLNEAKMPTLQPAFRKDGKGTITAGNASSLNDGAAALVLMTASRAAELNLRPLAKIIAFAEAGTAPVDFSIAPSLAIPKALKRANLTKDDVDLWEINEAFSATGLANIKELGLDHSKVNIHGGAVALGHPI